MTDAAQHSGQDRAGLPFRALIALIMIVMFGGTLPAPLYLIWQQELKFQEIVLTLIFAVYFIGAVLALLFFGRLADQIGRRKVIAGALALIAASTLCLIFARGLPLLFIGRALSGFGNALLISAGTAQLSELLRGDDARTRSAELSAINQFIGLGLGPLVAGLLAQYAIWPTLLSFYLFLGLLVVAGLLLLTVPETMEKPKPLSFRPQVGVPQEKLPPFLSLAATGFCIFAMVGLFTSLVPSVLMERLHDSNHAVAGAVAFELFLVAAVAELALRRWDTGRSILASLALIPLGLVLLMLGVVRPSPWFFVAGTAVVGVGVGIGFGNTLAAVNQLAPGEARGQVLSSYFLVTYSAAMLPVIGMGLITQYGNGLAADFTFACVIGLLAVAALVARLLGYTGQEIAQEAD